MNKQANQPQHAEHALGRVCPWWAVPALLALLAMACVWGSRFVPTALDATGNADALLVVGVVCAFFGVRVMWREAPETTR